MNEETILIRLHHAEKPERRLMVSPRRGLWLTNYALEREEVGTMASFLRRTITRARVLGVGQPEGERIAIIRLSTSKGLLKLIGEFFGEGNLIIVDEDDVVVRALRRLRVRHREIAPGKKYTLPPSRAIALTSLSLDTLKPLLSSNLEASRWLGRNLPLSKKYVEESLARAKVNPKALGSSLSEEDLGRVLDGIREVLRLAQSDGPAVVFLEGGKAVDAAPFQLSSYSGRESKLHPSHMEAVDEVFTEEILAERQRVSLRPIDQKVRELTHSIEEQRKLKERLLVQATTLRSFAAKLSEGGSLLGNPSLDTIAHQLAEMGAQSIEQRGNNFIISVGEASFEADPQLPIMTFASRLYDKAKDFERKVRAIGRAEESLLAERERLSRSLAEEEVVKVAKAKGEKAWFERYRWFITSDGLLAVGGRDASSNSAIIRKHRTPGDLVFHADIHGSPFFLLKEAEGAKKESIIEVAQAVASYSRAWREGFRSVDVYWVEPSQVKLGAPSGLYLPKGSFVIEGKRNYLKVELIAATGLHKLNERIAIMGGPPTAVRKNSIAYVVIEPDKETIANTAKKVKVELIKKVGDLFSSIKAIPLDDFIRALPPSGGKILYTDLGEQKYGKEY